MLLLPLLILSIILYIIGKRVSSVLIFFFFLFDGFQIVPEVLFDTHVGFSKSVDFAFFYMLVLFIYGIIKYDDFIPINRTSKAIAIYLLFIVVSIGVSLLYYHISIVDVVRTSRVYFLVLTYFVVRKLTRIELDKLMKILFGVVLFQCVLFMIQAFTGIALMTGADSGRTGIITRFYNVPWMLYYFAFYAIFCNPFSGIKKIITTIVPSITMFLPLHRSLMMGFILCIIIGIFFKIGGIKKVMKYLPIIIIVISSVLFIFVKVAGERTFVDLNNVVSGEFLEPDDDFVVDEESTFLFRMAHFIERFIDVTETKMGIIFGAGFMTEDSDYTYKNFDYQIGLQNDKTGGVDQLDTADISWSIFIIRYGVFGTLIFLSLFLYILSIYYKNLNSIGLTIFLYMILLFIISFTSDLMYQIRMLIFPILLLNLFPFDYSNLINLKVKNVKYN